LVPTPGLELATNQIIIPAENPLKRATI